MQCIPPPPPPSIYPDTDFQLPHRVTLQRKEISAGGTGCGKENRGRGFPIFTKLEKEEGSLGGHFLGRVTKLVNKLRQQLLFLLRFSVKKVKHTAKHLLTDILYCVVGKYLEREGGRGREGER